MVKVKTIAIVAAMVAAFGGISAAQDDTPGFEFDLSIDYVGKYIWRGQNLQDDGAIQPGFSVIYDKLTANIWGSLELSNINDNSGEITEVDYSLDYSDSIEGLEGVGYSIGLINYTFPNTDLDDTTEIYAGLSFDLPLAPSVTIYRDVDEAEGTYVSFGIGHEIEEIAEGVGMDISASIGWGSNAYNKFYWGIDDDSANDLAISVGFPIALGDWTLRPSVNYVTLLDSAVRASDTYASDSDYLFVGVGLSTSF